MDDPQNRDEDDVLDATPNRADLLAQPGGATGSDTRLHASEPAIVEPARVAALVEAACHMIEPECGDGYAYLQPQLEAIASRYLSDEAACLPALPPKLVRETLRHIGSLTTDLMNQLAALPNGVATALGSLVPPLEENAVPDLTLCDQGVEALALLRQATDSFDQAYGPPTGRGVNVALQSALLAAMTVIKTATGEVHPQRVEEDERIDRIERPLLPGRDFVEHRVGQPVVSQRDRSCDRWVCEPHRRHRWRAIDRQRQSRRRSLF